MLKLGFLNVEKVLTSVYSGVFVASSGRVGSQVIYDAYQLS